MEPLQNKHAKYTKSGDNVVSSLITKTRGFGPTHRDTKTFDDVAELKSFSPSILNCRLIKIRLWYGSLVPSLVVNGIQLTYENIDTGKQYETPFRGGNHQLLGHQDYFINNGEYIEKADVRGGQVIDQVKLITNKGKTIVKGGAGGSHTSYFEKGKVVVGMYGGYGGHLHNIGFYMTPIEEVRYWKRRSYLLMQARIKKNEDVFSQMVVELKTKKKPEAAFVLLSIQGVQLFALVMQYI